MSTNPKITLNKIEERFAERFVQHGGVLLLSKNDALSMVQMCIDEHVRVLGIDGFRFIGDMIQPTLEHSVDFSSEALQASYLDPAFRDPIEFLKTRPDDLMFEVVCSVG